MVVQPVLLQTPHKLAIVVGTKTCCSRLPIGKEMTLEEKCDKIFLLFALSNDLNEYLEKKELYKHKHKVSNNFLIEKKKE